MLYSSTRRFIVGNHRNPVERQLAPTLKDDEHGALNTLPTTSIKRQIDAGEVLPDHAPGPPCQFALSGASNCAANPDARAQEVPKTLRRHLEAGRISELGSALINSHATHRGAQY